jgi:hypothetical protein
MRGLLSLLVYAGLFYLMMRFGCGAHMIRTLTQVKEGWNEI